MAMAARSVMAGTLFPTHEAGEQKLRCAGVGATNARPHHRNDSRKNILGVEKIKSTAAAQPRPPL